MFLQGYDCVKICLDLHAKTALVILLFDFDRKQVTGRGLLMRGGGSIIQDLQNHEF